MDDINDLILLDLQMDAVIALTKRKPNMQPIENKEPRLQTNKPIGAIPSRYIPRQPGTAPASWAKHVSREEEIDAAYKEYLIKELTGG
jgi:hypothetical protein